MALEKTTFQYPIEDIDYPGKVIFTPIIDPPVEVGLLSSAVEAATAEGEEERRGENSELQTKRGRAPQIRESNKECVLFFPGSINISDAATYNNVDLGVIGGAAEAAIKAGSSALSGVASAGKTGIASFIDSFSSANATDAGKLAVNRLSGALGNEVAAAVKSQTRVTTNPNTRALFESVPLRTFQFSFKLIPHNATEAEEIKSIIRFFREELYPQEIAARELEFSIGYKFPNRFNIQFLYEDKEIATKIYYSYLTSFSAVYNASGMGMHSDGNFTEVDISMEFMESRALSRKDILEGY